MLPSQYKTFFSPTHLKYKIHKISWWRYMSGRPSNNKSLPLYWKISPIFSSCLTCWDWEWWTCLYLALAATAIWPELLVSLYCTNNILPSKEKNLFWVLQLCHIIIPTSAWGPESFAIICVHDFVTLQLFMVSFRFSLLWSENDCFQCFSHWYVDQSLQINYLTISTSKASGGKCNAWLIPRLHCIILHDWIYLVHIR